MPLSDVAPAALYRHFRSARGFILESLEGSGKTARYSCICTEPRLTVAIGAGGEVTLEGDTRCLAPRGEAGAADPVEALRDIMRRISIVPPDIPRFAGGMAGYVAYDTVYAICPSVRPAVPGDPGMPVARFMLAADCIVIDHRERTLTVVRGVDTAGVQDLRGAYEQGRAAIFALAERIRALPPEDTGSPAGKGCPDPACTSSLSRTEFCEGVLRLKEHILAGDIFQAVLSRRIACPFAGDPFAIYRALRRRNPSPYMYFLEFPDLAVAGSSPEMLVRVENGRVMTVPIAGTRPRGSGPAEDARLEQELLADAKERAEHVMLVDLARNDIGAVSRYGSVTVDAFMEIEKFSHVQHIVSAVSGELSERKDCFDVLASCFPAGTVSGAPKIRAMQLIEHVEGRRRGLYAGAIGHIGFAGSLDLAIAIRTVEVRESVASFQVGAGIVAGSDPESEWIETEDKGHAMRQAIGEAVQA
ncbi:MAG: anthranilate synthase component I family protein [Methanomicrobiales archaeon]|nr:anthranilate synthase component I family protein [Methanomicrobiales archaeon]